MCLHKSSDECLLHKRNFVTFIQVMTISLLVIGGIFAAVVFYLVKNLNLYIEKKSHHESSSEIEMSGNNDNVRNQTPEPAPRTNINTDENLDFRPRTIHSDDESSSTYRDDRNIRFGEERSGLRERVTETTF